MRRTSRRTWFLGADQRGDTIVEVLLAIALVSLALSGGFAMARRSTATIQRNEERMYASRLLETQAERLKILARDEDSPVYDGGISFCVNDALAIQPTGCSETSPLGIANQYTVITQRDVSDQNLFVIDVTWQGSEDDETETQQVTAFYKIYPGL